MGDELRVAVVGAGMMGANHARVVNGSSAAILAAVVDADVERREAVAANSGAATYADVGALLDHGAPIDAAVVATPTATHREIATALLHAGVPVLVEKPLAATVADARALADLSRRTNVLLVVGHVERFNPAVRELLRLEQRPIHVEAHRVGPFAARIPDSVVSDLMIHDLDIVGALAGGRPTSVTAVAQRVRSESEDMATALLAFDSGTTATITASRLGQQKIRQLQLTMPDAFVVADLLRQDVSITRVDHTEYLSEDGSRYRQTASVEIPFLDNRGEPLAAQLASFLRAVRDGGPPEVTAEDGVTALEMVGQVLDAAR